MRHRSPPRLPAARDLRARRRRALVPALVVGMTILSAGTAVQAQTATTESGVRFGVTFGGISTWGVNVEFFEGQYGLDVNLGTWTFRDLGIAVSGRRYLGDHVIRPYAGSGLWFALGAPVDESERVGMALVLQFPVGVEWDITDTHALGLNVNVNRGLLVRRSDPEDDLPMAGGIVPFPGFYYRYTR
ncbi:MAG: hypothetical protein OEZ65_02970 [Gemmatimonadota bacterium]|nr:hypothetical protein [Gemmatimonadota bacterium]